MNSSMAFWATLWVATIPACLMANEGSRISDFRREVSQHAAMLRLPGCCVAVMQDDNVLFREGFGFSNVETRQEMKPDSVFWIASITKSFSSVMLMQYVQENRISLDDPITSYPFVSIGFFPQRVTPAIRLKHVLSHTSEATPGESFIYHGGRFNFVAGVFDSVHGDGPRSFAAELQNRIIGPLALESTFAGTPERDSPKIKQLVTPYRFDSSTRRMVVHKQLLRSTMAYPATGLLSSVDDILRYSKALDNGRLLTRDSYRTMTTPMTNPDGEQFPYAFGWFVEDAYGVEMHWAYGLGAADSALLLRIPERHLTLVLLSNSSFASAPFRLGSGRALNSPFVTSFIKHFVLPKSQHRETLDFDQPSKLPEALSEIALDELCAQAFARTYVESQLGIELGSSELVAILCSLDKQRFSVPQPSLMNLLANHPDPRFNDAKDALVRSIRKKHTFHPEVEFDVARRLERQGLTEQALRAYRNVADHRGFKEQESTIEASSEAARILAAAGKHSMALQYQWRSICYANQAGNNIQSKLDTLKKLHAD